ncbi:rifin [Plasmodium falciparum RAJ116]|uniref:Rifin n=1 Tax=Plasmodium falciparum RAJ116 TaxID=580058 RepID=A0A0L0CTA6_PLAFA|nr:rifin [Plasmodium falciparum RAJ116]
MTIKTMLLCECDLYKSIYDNDPQMKKVMGNFNKQTEQRFHVYDEKTKIDTNDIPTCVCEKSVADEVEKACLKYGGILGGGMAPPWGFLSGLSYAAWINYTTNTLVKIATDEVKTINSAMCGKFDDGPYAGFSMGVQNVARPTTLRSFTEQPAAVETAFNNAKTGILTKSGNVTNSLTTAIIASVVAIVVIVLVMVIIYLILRYRRKKKNEKKTAIYKIIKGINMMFLILTISLI